MPEGDLEAFKAALREGPVGIAYAASNEFMYFREGFYDGPCNPTGMNHAMVAIGYGTQSDGSQFTIIRNSWG